MTTSSKRAEHVALASLILSVIFFGIAFFVGRWSGFFAVSALSWFILAAAIIWFVLCLQFHQCSLAEREKLDMTQLATSQKDAAIFQAKGEHATLFAVAQRRLRILEKWFIPIFSVLIAVYQIAIGLYFLKALFALSDVEPKQPLLVAIGMAAIAFVSFLMSRYATGMSAQPQWKPLRAGGSFLLGIAVLCFALAVSMALMQFKIFVVINIINWVVPILLVVLGSETAVNVVLDIYRPRLKDQYARTAFDSRLLGVISEPGGILRSAADAIDYQFGFEVSQTWFYKLLEKAIAPLVLFAAVTLYLLSCIVVVAANEEAIIERFGNPLNDANGVRVVGPGLAFKWPWPIDIAYSYPTKRISEISIGFVPNVPNVDPKTGELSREPLLWGEHHYKKEYQLLVASEQTSEGSTAGAVPVSLLIAAVPVQYRVKDLYSFIYNHDEPEKLLESICYRELTRFAAGQVGSKGEGAAGVQETLLGAGRAKAKRVLTTRIQQAVDEAGLGVEIVFLGLQGVHPPPDVAADYQQVIGAVQKKQALILDAQAERNKTLSTLVGSVQKANELYTKYQEAKKQNQSEQAEKAANDLDQDFDQASGDIYKTLRESHSYTFEIATLARATGLRFASQLKAYRAAEQIYLREQVLAARVEALKDIRKYVVVADPNSLQVFIVDVTEKQIPSLYDFQSFQESSQK